MSNLSRKILTTIVYYDILNYPLTVFEVWKYLGVEEEGDLQKETVTLGEIVSELDGDELKEKIESWRGFYFIRGRTALVEKRLEKNKLSEQKFKIIKRVVFWLRFLPYVRMVAVTGTVAMKNASKSSDLDLLIVFKRGRIFFGRLLVTGVVHLMGKRRYGKKIANRVCLNCFLTEQSLESRLKDLFSASEYFFIVPLLGQKTFAEFQTQNRWIKKFKNNFYLREVSNLKSFSDKGFAVWIRNGMESFFNLNIFNALEAKLGKWQITRIANDPRTKEAGSIIMADPEVLIFFHQAHSLSMHKLFRRKTNE